MPLESHARPDGPMAPESWWKTEVWYLRTDGGPRAASHSDATRAHDRIPGGASRARSRDVHARGPLRKPEHAIAQQLGHVERRAIGCEGQRAGLGEALVEDGLQQL